MLSKLFLITLLGAASLASPINLADRDSSSIVFGDVPVAHERDSSNIVFGDVPVADKRDTASSAIVFMEAPIAEEKRSDANIVMGDVPIAGGSD
ncbi:hypothetical protein GGR53DRAFT_332525 [Hypoxylon sp. FL1150]|nr:hypothetical protein GGR53DRAFT_332525 [Hypoxylon sp. FL1150]